MHRSSFVNSTLSVCPLHYGAFRCKLAFIIKGIIDEKQTQQEHKIFGERECS